MIALTRRLFSAFGPNAVNAHARNSKISMNGLPKIQFAPPPPTILPPTVLINCLRNNIFITVSDTPGKHIFHLSSGLAGFAGTQKTSPKAAMAMLDTLQRRLEELKVDKIRLNFRGLNSARPVLVSHLRRMGLQITEVIDTTRVPFNGCRPPKKKRL